MNALSGAAAVDPDKISNGIEVTFYLDDKAFRTTITRGGEFNEALQREAEKLMRPYRNSGLSMEQLPPKVQKKFMAQLYADHVILGWNEHDFAEAFSKEAARKLLENVDEYRIFIINQSNQADKFRKDAVAAVEGN